MAIDTKSLTELISDFRKITAKDSITPDSLGYILQRITDLLATAGTSETISAIQKLLDGFKVAGQAITSLEQGSADRNNILVNQKTVGLADGSVATSTNKLFIQQATTERAGAMRAQQVTDLNAARRDVSAMQKQLAEVDKVIDEILVKLGMEGGKGVYNTAQIACEVRHGALYVRGAAQLIADGYVPYIFRPVRKRNPFKDRDASADERANKKYCEPHKGWGVYGSMYAVKIVDSQVQFTTGPHSHLCIEQHNFSEKPETFVSKHVNTKGEITFGWGRSSVSLADTTNKITKQRMIRLRFGIGFAKPIKPGKAKITPANLVSSLAEFSIIYDVGNKKWYFGHP